MTRHEENQYYSQQKKVWRILALFYDTLTAPFRGLRDVAVRFTNAQPCSKVLDVATGTGDQAFAFARKGYDVTGADLSCAMLKIARKKDGEKIRLTAADATRMPFKDACFDVSFISFALHEMPPSIREKTLKEMVRVTREDGLIMVSDYSLPRAKVLRFLVYHLVRLYEGNLYARFIKSDFEAVLRKSGIEVKEELPLLLGAARIMKGRVARKIQRGAFV